MSSTPLSRDDFDLASGRLWVMHCAEGSVPRSAARAVADFMGKELRPWEVSWGDDFIGLPQLVRLQAARLLRARASDISLVPTTTAGLALVAQGYPWREGDEVVLPLGEFPSNLWPWKSLAARGVTLREVPLWDGHRAGAAAWESAPPPADVEPEERLLAALGPRTRLLAVSWVRFQDGLRLDLAALARGARAAGVDLVVDGIQGAGTLPLELDGVAAFAAGGHKGLLAPQGLGLLWTDPELRARLAPPGGWLSVEQATDFSRPSTDHERDWAADGSRLESGVPNLLGCAALAASLELLNRAGVERIHRHVTALAGRLLAGIAAEPAWTAEAERLWRLLGGGRLGSILAVHHLGRGPAGLAALLADGMRQGIHASVREGYLRVALHGWHDVADGERLRAWLTAAAERGTAGELATVRAAGGVVVRQTPAGPEVVLVRRPRYGDWSLPKGKLDPGESFEEAARREVCEETGLTCELGAELGATSYRDRHGRLKLVRYWRMRALAGEVARRLPDMEIGEARWVGVAEARNLMSYPRERALLDELG